MNLVRLESTLLSRGILCTLLRRLRRADTHCEKVGPALGLFPDGRRGVGCGRDIDAELLLAGAWSGWDGGGIVT